MEYGIDWWIEKGIRLLSVLLALTVHEFCHGYFAYRMGDPTAYQAGRLTLNPLKHLDPLGTLCLLFAPIGWAKPVPINPMLFRDRRMGILVSTATGPLSNLVQAVVFGLALRAVIFFTNDMTRGDNTQAEQFVQLLTLFCFFAVLINVGLAMFNFLPVYPLDGFHITMQLLPPGAQQRFAETATMGPFLILGLIVVEHASEVDILSRLIMPVVEFILQYVVGLPMNGAGVQ